MLSRVGIACLILVLSAPALSQTEAQRYVRAVVGASDSSLNKAAIDPASVPGYRSSGQEGDGAAKALAASVASFRTNARQLLALISPDSPAIGKKPLDPQSLKAFLQRYSSVDPIPLSFVDDYDKTVLSQVDAEGRSDFGEGQAGAFYVACLTTRLLIANNAFELLRRDPQTSAKTLKAMVDDALRTFREGTADLPASLREKTDSTLTVVRPLFDKKIAEVSAAGEDDGFRLLGPTVDKSVTEAAKPPVEPPKPPAAEPAKPPSVEPVRPPVADPVPTPPAVPPTAVPTKPPVADPAKPAETLPPVPKPTAPAEPPNKESAPAKPGGAPAAATRGRNAVAMSSQPPTAPQSMASIYNHLPAGEETIDLDLDPEADASTKPFDQAVASALSELRSIRLGNGLRYPNGTNAFMWVRKLGGKTSEWWKTNPTKAAPAKPGTRLLPFVDEPNPKNNTPRSKAIALNQQAIADWMQTGKTTEAVDALIKAANADPTYYAPMWNAGLLAASGCNWDYAIKLFARATERGVPASLGEVTKGYVAALRATQNLLTLPEGSQRRLCEEGLETAWFLARSGSYRAAVASTAEVISLDDTNPEPFLIGAWIASRNGLRAEAKLCVQEALARTTPRTSKYVSPLFKMLPTE